MSDELIKHGEVTKDSFSDFATNKKAVYYDELGTGIADEDHKHKLKKPMPISEIEPVE